MIELIGNKAPEPRRKIGDIVNVWIEGNPYPARIFGVSLTDNGEQHDVILIHPPAYKVNDMGQIIHTYGP